MGYDLHALREFSQSAWSAVLIIQGCLLEVGFYGSVEVGFVFCCEVVQHAQAVIEICQMLQVAQGGGLEFSESWLTVGELHDKGFRPNKSCFRIFLFHLFIIQHFA